MQSRRQYARLPHRYDSSKLRCFRCELVAAPYNSAQSCFGALMHMLHRLLGYSQTVEEEPYICQDRVIRIPWGGRPDGSTPVILPIKEAKALRRCTVKSNRRVTKKGAARSKNGCRTGSGKQEQKVCHSRIQTVHMSAKSHRNPH
jgi:hypothetical protein